MAGKGGNGMLSVALARRIMGLKYHDTHGHEGRSPDISTHGIESSSIPDNKLMYHH